MTRQLIDHGVKLFQNRQLYTWDWMFMGNSKKCGKFEEFIQTVSFEAREGQGLARKGHGRMPEDF